ncbi:MAG: adenylate cyclase [Anaerobutyricum sp.]
MQNNIRNTNLRFNLNKDQQRKAWEYLQTMDRQEFKSYSQAISVALVDYFDRHYRTQSDPYLETREREELFVKQIVAAVESSLKQSLPLFLSGLTAGIAQREPRIRASFSEAENTQADTDIDWDFLEE